jgi:hypothetical protein
MAYSIYLQLSPILEAFPLSAVMTGVHCTPDIIRMMKSRRIRWTGLVARMGRGEEHTGFWWENLKEGDHLEDPGGDGRIILRWICKKWDGSMEWIDLALDRDR